MKLILARHGETEDNINKINQGHKPGKLTHKGIDQAKKLALRLKDEKIDKIYVSDLKRAVDTAAEVIKYHPNAEVIYTEELREQDLGIHEGKPYGTIGAAAEDAGIERQEFKPEGGESLLELRKRASDFIHKLIKENHDKTVLLITHGGPIRQYLIHLQKDPEEKTDYKHGNCAVTILETDGHKHEIHALKCEKHLTE
jgi:broad specificity phosphatase PhoE